MKTFLFWTSLICTTLLCVFCLTRLSLNGYKTDFYFFLVTLILNLVCFWALYKNEKTRRQSFINFSLAALQLFGLSIFLWVDTLQVDKVEKPGNTRHNQHTALSGWYKKVYFKQNRGELCKDGELWETSVPYSFPVIEIEISRDPCHKVGTDSNYTRLFIHRPE